MRRGVPPGNAASSGNGLREWLEQHKGINPRAADDHILRWRRSGSHITLSNDDQFNAGKGRLELSPSSDGRTWRIRITDINRGALLRVNVSTASRTWPRLAWSSALIARSNAVWNLPTAACTFSDVLRYWPTSSPYPAGSGFCC